MPPSRNTSTAKPPDNHPGSGTSAIIKRFPAREVCGARRLKPAPRSKYFAYLTYLDQPRCTAPLFFEHELWPWLKHRGFADDGDDSVLRRFLDEYLRLPAQMRPGLRLRRVWTPAEVVQLGSALAETIRGEFDAVFAVADEPTLTSVERAASPGLGAPYCQVPATVLSGSRDLFSVDPALVERGLQGRRSLLPPHGDRKFVRTARR